MFLRPSFSDLNHSQKKAMLRQLTFHVKVAPTKDYEEALQDMMENGGFACGNPAMVGDLLSSRSSWLVHGQSCLAHVFIICD